MASTTTLQLPSGSILARLENNVVRARGIPYAQANRFQPPCDTTEHNDIIDCTQAATVCPQDPSRLEKIIGPTTAGHVQSEDCLHLSITAPENAENAPVMVFFHGGAYVSGGGDLDVYSGQPLTAQEHVIVVSVTYRLSIFGYLRVPNIASANLGLMDQVSALRWVRNNISAFGGNKENVTIFGQSAGGDSVFCLLLADTAKGLYHRAVIESAPFSWYQDGRQQKMANALGGYASAQLINNAEYSSTDLLDLKRKLQIFGAKEDPESILCFGTELGQPPLPPAEMVDDALREVAKSVQIMIGWVEDEGTAFVDTPSSEDSGKITIRDFVAGATYYHKVISEEQKSPTYTFTWSPSDTLYGAAHCIELPFLLGTPGAWESAPMLGSESGQKNAKNLGKEMKKMWAGFARGEVRTDRHIVIDETFQCEEIL